MAEITNDPLRRLAASLLHQPADQEDALQETWLAHYSLRGAIRDPLGWRSAVLRNKARRMYRQRAREDGLNEEVEARLVSDASGPAEVLDAEFVRELLQAALAGLPASQSDVLRLRYFEGLTPVEIGERLGRPVPTVKTQLSRGLEGMREALDRKTGSTRLTALALLRGFDLDLPVVAAKGASVSSVAAALASGPGALLLGLLLVLGVWLGFFQDRRGASPQEALEVAELVRLEGASERVVPVEAEPSSRDQVAAADAPANALPFTESEAVERAHASSPSTMGLTFVGVTQSGVPVPDFEVSLWKGDDPSDEWSHGADAGGRLTLVVEDEGVQRQAHESLTRDDESNGSRRYRRASFRHPSMARRADLNFPFVPGSERDIEILFNSEPGSLKLTVMDPEGRPIEGAVLTLPRANTTWSDDLIEVHQDLLFRTNIDGEAIVTQMSPGMQRLRISKHGFVPLAFGFSVEPLAAHAGPISLEKAVAVSGRVSDAAGQPVPGAYVNSDSSLDLKYLWAFSDEDGYFEFAHLPEGTHRLWAHAPNGQAYDSTTLNLIGDSAQGVSAHWDPVLLEREALTVEMVDENGTAVRGASLLLIEGVSFTHGAWFVANLTDENGRAVFSKLPQGSVRLKLAPTGADGSFNDLGSLEFPGLVPQAEPYRFQIDSDFFRLGSFRGRTVNADGAPLNDLYISACSSISPELIPLHPTNGEFSQADVPPGDYIVLAGRGIHGLVSRNFRVEPNEEVDLGDIVVQGAGGIEAIDRWDSDRAPLRRVQYEADFFGSPHPFLAAIIREKLTNTSDMIPGRYSVEVLDVRFRPLQRREFEVRAGEITQVVLDPELPSGLGDSSPPGAGR